MTLPAGYFEAMYQAAAGRAADLTHVRVEQRDITREWPGGRFDLIVLSEILYYFGAHDLEQVLKRAATALDPEGTLLAGHHLHLRAVGRGDPEGLWRISLEAVDGWTLRADADAAEDKGPFARLLGTP
jgi:SAM-dependent methyltransferase